MLRGNTNFLTVAVVVTVVVMHSSLQASAEESLPPMPSYVAPLAPACLTKYMDCVNEYLKSIDFKLADAKAAEPKPICCPELTAVIENDRKCYCEATGAFIATNATEVDKLYKVCNVGVSAKTVCQDTNGATSGTKWIGTICGSMLLLAGLLLY
ncbi:hypothetical protein RND81_13G046700 [Saponaria officinalis]|uniref:Bifunctional inhibitor/plant lipid transfer protein/seed storage helical domain-containing protein n=1 Tax=Saponaria officinalis TaxID=3572 RepID=A0AAW1GWU9_SAPOF